MSNFKQLVDGLGVGDKFDTDAELTESTMTCVVTEIREDTGHGIMQEVHSEDTNSDEKYIVNVDTDGQVWLEYGEQINGEYLYKKLGPVENIERH
jgi:hypothetical protein